MSKLPVTFAIKSIETVEFATIEDAYKNGEKVGITSGFDLGISNESHALKVQFNLSFICEDRPFIILKVVCDFSIEPKGFEKFKNTKGDKITIPKAFLAHLAVITVGTARGVLHAKLDKTDFDQFLLPSLNISQMFENDVVFNLGDSHLK